MLFELRQYWCKQGKRSEWARYMDEVIIPYQIQKGMVIIASFVDEEDPDHYVWIRRFDSEQHRENLYEKVYSSHTWKVDMLPKVEEMLDRERSVITRLNPTPKSVVR